MTDPDPLVETLHEGRRRFLELVSEVRPDLHRYCARMTGSVADGEDIVQDTLARAYYALSELETLPPLRPWLFQIAHNRALDQLRRYDRRMRQALDEVADVAADTAGDPEDALAREEATRAAISRFVELVPMQRSTVILKDVLGHSLEEIAELLELSVSAVKAALHRGRERLRLLAEAAPREVAPVPAASPGVARYAALFNARDWEGVRAMLAEDVRLDLVSRSRRSGRRDVSSYFTNYAAVRDWHLVPAWVDAHEVIGVFRDRNGVRPDYFVELTLSDGLIVRIKDFRYVPYISVDAEIVISPAMSHRSPASDS
jgi:RNA polymerase sigma factor (sigma-70 family)